MSKKHRGNASKMAPGGGGDGHGTAEDNFKVCGLCSQLVDESVQVNDKLRAFLIQFLSVPNDSLPSKVCTDCYSHSLESMKFKDRCEKAISKLKTNKVTDAMVLGRSTDDKKYVKTLASAMPEPLVKRGQVDMLEDFDIPRFPTRKDLQPLGPRAHRAAKYPDRLPQPRTSIILSFSEKAVAEKALYAPYWSISYESRPKALVTPQRPPKRAANGTPSSTGRQPAKKARVSSTASRRVSVDPLALPEPSTPTAPPPEASVSSFGRVRKPKKGYVFDDDDSFLDDSLTDPPFTAPSPPRPAAPTNGVGNKSTKKADPPKAKSKDAPKKGTYYYVGQDGKDENQKLVEVSKDEEEDDEEIFPSIGPYQCEICQNITNTKQEFVDHIKKFHRNVVDEGVLISLETDLKKSKLKKARADMAARQAQGGGGGAKGSVKSKLSGPKSKMAAARAKVPASARTDLTEPVEKRTCIHCDLVLTYSKDMYRHVKTATCLRKRREKENKVRKAKGLPPLDPISNGTPPMKAEVEESPPPRTKHERTAKSNAQPIIDGLEVEEDATPAPTSDASEIKVPTAAARKSMEPLPSSGTTAHYKPKTKVVEQYEKERESAKPTPEKITQPSKQLLTPKKTEVAPRQATPTSTVFTPVKKTTIVRETPTTIVTSDSYFDGGVDFEEPEESGLGGGIMVSHDPVKRAMQEAAVDRDNRSPPYSHPPQQQPPVQTTSYQHSSVWMDPSLNQSGIISSAHQHHQQLGQQQQHHQPMPHHLMTTASTLDLSSLNPSITNAPLQNYGLGGNLGGTTVVVNDQTHPQQQILMPDHHHLNVLNTPHHNSFY